MSHVPGRSSSNLARVAIALVALGAVLRLVKFLERPGLWIDEAMIALNVGPRSYAELLAPLDYTQLAPVPWLWLEKLLVDLAGMHELVLRAPALLAGVALSWLVWRAGLHLVGEWGAVIATALTATAATLLVYSVEAKPYAVDAAIAALLLLLGGRCLMRPLGDVRAMRTLGVGGVVALLCSFPSLFMVGGLGIALLVRAMLARHATGVRSIVAWGVVWVLVFAVPQLLLYRYTGGGGDMQGYWQPVMAQIGAPGLVGRTSGAINALLAALIDRQVWPGAELYLLVLVFGAWTIARKRGLVTMLAVTTPLLLLAIAWLLDQIPAADRLLLFAAPILALLFGAAVAQVIHYVPFRVRPVGAAVAVVSLGWLMLAEARTGMAQRKPSAGRGVVLRMLEEPPAPVWLTRRSAAVWLYYSTDWAAPDTARLDWYAAQANAGWLDHDLPTFDDGSTRTHFWNHRLERLADANGLTPVAGGILDGGTLAQWADHEVRHLAPLTEARPWLLMIHEIADEREVLLSTLRDAGLTVDSVAAEKRSDLWRLRVAEAQTPSATSTSSIEPQR